MGLDMYLLKRNKRQKHDYSNLAEIGYWRKANSIHKWFVDNCQDGVDDCQCYQVRKDDIETLLNLCKEVKASISFVEREVEDIVGYDKNGEMRKKLKRKFVKNPYICDELLPTQSGFFFGGTEYDEYYAEDIDNTIKILEGALAETDFQNEVIFYESSW